MTLSTGQVIKNYEIIELAGTGGFGAVYRAKQFGVEREVAIKVILSDHSNRPDFIRRFEAEAQFVARLEHPHIVPLFDYWRDPEGAYLVMRWIPNSLRQMSEKTRFRHPEILALFTQLATALDVAHRYGVIHRDIKPDNVLLDQNGNAYLSDFGIAKDLTSSVSTTGEKEIIGTLHYSAPEQLSGLAVTPASDIYSIGIMLYELLIGEAPFANMPLHEIVSQKLSPQFLPVFPADMSHDIKFVIQKAMRFSPEERYQTIIDFINALHEAMSGHTSSIVNHIAPAENPYRGLRPFEEADARYFYGRESLIEQLIALQKNDQEQANFLAVIGPSGSGKSSVVKAGVLPQLRAGALPQSHTWFIVEMTPGTDPVGNLAAALMGVARRAAVYLEDQLKSNENGLLWAADNLLIETDGDLLIFIDQFEELFTSNISETSRTHFLNLLYTAVTTEQSRIRIILTLRADFTDRPLNYAKFAHLMRNRICFVTPLNVQELEKAITEPARRAHIQIDTNLIAAMVADVRDEPGMLPLLQYALTEVFERCQKETSAIMTLDAYKSIGGVIGALAQRAEDVYNSLTSFQQAFVPNIFLRLITLGEGTEDTRRRVLISELNSLAPDQVQIEEVLTAFGQHRLLTFDRDLQTRESTVEVAHEALIREWTRLHEWLDSQRADLRLQRALMGLSTEWKLSQYDKSFLLRGARLVQYEEWLQATDVALTEEEKAYLGASLIEQGVQEAQEKERYEREHHLMMRSRRILVSLVMVLTFATCIALSLSYFAFQQSAIAQENASTATVALGVIQERGTQIAQQVEISDSNLIESWDIQSLLMGDFSRQQLEVQLPRYSLALALESFANYPQVYRHESHQALINALTYPTLEVNYLRHDNAVRGAAWNEDETLVLTWSVDKTARVWRDGEEIAILPHHSVVYGARWSRDSKHVITWTVDGTISLWDIETRTVLKTFRHLRSVTNVLWNHDETQLLAWSVDGAVILWDVASGLPRYQWRHSSVVNGAAWTPDETRIITWSVDTTVQIWDASTGVNIQTLQNDLPVKAVVCNRNCSGLLTVAENAVKLRDVGTGSVLQTFRYEGSAIIGAFWDYSAKRVIIWTQDGQVKLWDDTSGQLLMTFEHGGAVNQASFSQDKRFLLTSSQDGKAYLWDISTGELRFTLAHERSQGGVLGSQWNQTETLILTWGADGRAHVWSAETGQLLFTLRHNGSVLGATWDKAEERILTWSSDNTAHVWARNNRYPQTFSHTDPISGALWSPDESQILIWTTGNHAYLWNPDNPDEPRVLETETPIIGALWRNLIVLWTENTVYFFHPLDLSPVLTLRQGSFTRGIAWGTDYFLTWSGSIAQIRDISSGEAITNLQHSSHIDGAAFNADERYVFTQLGSAGFIWDRVTGEQLQRLAHDNQINGGIWNTTGTEILTWTNNSVNIWDAETGESKFRHISNVTINDVAWSHDNAFIAIVTGTHVQILAVEMGEITLEWDESTPIQAIDWSENNKFLLTWGSTNRLQVWDAETGEHQVQLQYSSLIQGAAFRSDGKQVLAWTSDNQVWLWTIDIELLLEIGQEQLSYPLSNEERELFFLPTIAVTPTAVSPTLLPLPSLTPDRGIPSLTPIPSVTPLPSS